MARQFVVTLMNFGGIVEQLVNCNSLESARIIAEGLHSGYRAIDVRENT